MSKATKPAALNKAQRRDPLASLKLANMMISKPALPTGKMLSKDMEVKLNGLRGYGYCGRLFRRT